MTTILSIDPGNVTGIAWYDTVEPGPPSTWEVEGGLTGFVDFAWDFVLTNIDEVYIEDWILRPDSHKKTRQPDAYLILGYVQGVCYQYGIPLTKIGPSEHTPFTNYKTRSKSKIVRLGWDNQSKDAHADSASSVLLLGLVRNHPAHAAEILKEITLDGNT